MIKEDTVFILGAGASAPYGLPLGKQLYDVVVGEFGDGSSLAQELALATPFPRRNVDEFINALHYSGLSSVDAFLERRPEFLEVGKAMMALALLREENHSNLWNAGNNWMKYLYDRLVTDSLPEFVQNRIAFITYNYDRTFEHFLFTSLKNTYGAADEAVADVLNNLTIIHLHGRLGYLPWQRRREVVPFEVEAPVDPRLMEIC
jgi:hypothetical protein